MRERGEKCSLCGAGATLRLQHLPTGFAVTLCYWCIIAEVLLEWHDTADVQSDREELIRALNRLMIKPGKRRLSLLRPLT